MHLKLPLLHNILKSINLSIKQCLSPKPTLTPWPSNLISLNLSLLIQIREIIKTTLQINCVNSMRPFNNALSILPESPLPLSNC